MRPIKELWSSYERNPAEPSKVKETLIEANLKDKNKGKQLPKVLSFVDKVFNIAQLLVQSDGKSWEQRCQCHLRAVMPVSLGNNRARLTREQSCQSHLETIVPALLGSSLTSVTRGILCHCLLETIVTVTCEQLCQSHFGIVMPVSLENNRASVTW